MSVIRKRYVLCEVCEVGGVGSVCWYCGSSDVKRTSPWMNNVAGHSFIYARREALIPDGRGGTIQVEGPPVETLLELTFTLGSTG